MTTLFDPPEALQLPLSRGVDLYAVFEHQVPAIDENGFPVLDESGQQVFEVADYPDDVVVTLTIDTRPPITLDATITGAEAMIWQDAATTDMITAGRLWRLTMTHQGITTPICNGVTTRNDGRAAL